VLDDEPTPGVVVTFLSDEGVINALAFQPDGKLIAAGQVNDENPNFGLARYLDVETPEGDSDGDGVPDASDNCPTPNPDQSDRDHDSIGDVCDPFPNDPDNAEARCERDLRDCNTREFADDDGDGEADATDRCPVTSDRPVDGDGCSLAQFCARIEITSRDTARACKKADWRNDEPSMKQGEADCRLDKGGRGEADDRCVARE
jgi:hypothetical protein